MTADQQAPRSLSAIITYIRSIAIECYPKMLMANKSYVRTLSLIYILYVCLALLISVKSHDCHYI